MSESVAAILATDVCNCTALRKAARHVAVLYDRAFRGTGFTSVSFAILAELDRQPPGGALLHRLARILVVERSVLARHLRWLESKRWVMVSSPARDRRQRVVRISRAGRRELMRTKPIWRLTQSRFEKSLGDSRSHELRALLAAVKVMQFES